MPLSISIELLCATKFYLTFELSIHSMTIHLRYTLQLIGSHIAAREPLPCIAAAALQDPTLLASVHVEEPRKDSLFLYIDQLTLPYVCLV